MRPVAQRGGTLDERREVVLGGQRQGLRRARAVPALHRIQQIAGRFVHLPQAASVTRRRSAIPLSRR